tara:strand:- start:1575 stop:2336 length:762 start_codon:yes stop_codon:yes gene_type:complete
MNIEAELHALSTVQASNLTTRSSTISIPSSDININLSSYFNDDNIIAVEGYSKKKRHMCLLIGEIPGADVPDPKLHIVQEFHYKDLNEEKIEDNREMPKGFPAKIDGFAMLQLIEKQPTPTPTTQSPTGGYPELSTRGTKYVGTPEGGMRIGKEGNAEIITGDGSTISFGENLDLGEKQLASMKDGFTNWFLVKNGFRDGSWLGAPLPNVLPLFPLTYDPFPNIPGIAELYLKVKMYKELVFGIRDLIDEVND